MRGINPNFVRPTNPQQIPTPKRGANQNAAGEAMAGQMIGWGFRTGAGFFTGGAASLPGIGGVGSLDAGSSIGGSGMDSLKFESLINQQLETQAVMQVYSMRSNIEKTRHDTAMTAINNMKA